jgi:hypothetical protein
VTDFLVKDLRQLVWGKGAASAISIDPRLYDSYGVTMVPGFVLTRTRENFTCIGAGSRTITEHGKTGSYPLCPPIDSNSYVKMSGAVTLDYALDAFQAEGFDEASVYLNALRRGYPNRSASREQKPFDGEWQDALAPRDAEKDRPTDLVKQ